MSRLTTVAAYDDPEAAKLAREYLELAGIPVVVADQEVVSEWLRASAIGRVEVRVREADVERAAEVLDRRLGDAAGLVSGDVDEDELTRQALAEPREDGDEADEDEEADER